MLTAETLIRLGGLDTFLARFKLEPEASVAQSVVHLTGKSEVLGLIPGLATYFRFSFC